MTVRDTQMVRDQKKFENHWCKGSRPPGNLLTPPWGGVTPRLRTTDLAEMNMDLDLNPMDFQIYENLDWINSA